MNKIRYLFCIAGLFVLSALYAQEVPKIRIDPSQAYGGTVSEYFDSVEYIPLETTKESLFGDALKFIVTDSGFVFFDSDLNSLFFFALNGKFITKYKFPVGVWPSIAYAPLEKRILTYYSMPNDVILTESFTLTGAKKDEQRATNTVHQTYLANGYSIRFNGHQVSKSEDLADSLVNLVDVLKNGKLVKSMLPYNKRKNLLQWSLFSCPLRLSGVNDGEFIYASTFLDHRIYKIDADAVEPLFSIIFPANRTIPQNLMKASDSRVIDSLKKAYRDQPDLIVAVDNLFFQGDLFSFKIIPVRYIWNESTVANAQYNFFYDMNSGRLSSFERIIPDEKSYYLPISDGPRTSINGVAKFKDCIYTTVSSQKMFNSIQKNESKNPEYPPGLKEYFKSQNRKSNLVVVRMKLKE